MTVNYCNDCYRCHLIGVKVSHEEDRVNNIYIAGKLYYYQNHYKNSDGEYTINLLKKCCYLRYYGLYTPTSELKKDMFNNLNVNIVYNAQLNDYLYEVDFEDTEIIANPFKHSYTEVQINRDLKYILVKPDSCCIC